MELIIVHQVSGMNEFSFMRGSERQRIHRYDCLRKILLLPRVELDGMGWDGIRVRGGELGTEGSGKQQGEGSGAGSPLDIRKGIHLIFNSRFGPTRPHGWRCPVPPESPEPYQTKPNPIPSPTVRDGGKRIKMVDKYIPNSFPVRYPVSRLGVRFGRKKCGFFFLTSNARPRLRNDDDQCDRDGVQSNQIFLFLLMFYVLGYCGTSHLGDINIPISFLKTCCLTEVFPPKFGFGWREPFRGHSSNSIPLFALPYYSWI